MRFHETIKYIRIKLNLTQKDIYEGIVSQSTYSRFENGLRILPIEDIEVFANRLGMQLSDVYTIRRIHYPKRTRQLHDLHYQSN